MKYLFIALLLVPGLSLAETASGDGRYQFVNTSDSDFVIDSKTGEIWQKVTVTGQSELYFAPVKYIIGDGRCAYAPNSKELYKCFKVPEK